MSYVNDYDDEAVVRRFALTLLDHIRLWHSGHDCTACGDLRGQMVAWIQAHPTEEATIAFLNETAEARDKERIAEQRRIAKAIESSFHRDGRRREHRAYTKPANA